MEYLTKQELRRLFQVAFDRNRNHHMAMLVGLWHGLRVSEIIHVRGTHVVDGQLSVKRLKRSKTTLQPIHADADPLFDETPLIQMAAENKGRLFNFSRQRMDQFIKAYGELAGLHPEKCHAHAVCKHSLAMLLWDQTHSLGQIQSYLGHRASSSTLCYLVEADARVAQAAVAEIAI
jgi:site-specific recombinase XerD